MVWVCSVTRRSGLVAFPCPRARRALGECARKTSAGACGQARRRALAKRREILIGIVLAVIELAVLIVYRRGGGLAGRLLLGVGVGCCLLLVLRLFEPAADSAHDGRPRGSLSVDQIR